MAVWPFFILFCFFFVQYIDIVFNFNVEWYFSVLNKFRGGGLKIKLGA